MTNTSHIIVPRLGVNIDHVATLRNARGGDHPDPVAGAWSAIQSGADGITAHLREDRRHINDDDLVRLQALCTSSNVPLNMEMAAVPEMLEIALKVKPHAVCLVPERREERTTEGGLDVLGGRAHIGPIVERLKANGSRVSLFIEATANQIQASADIGSDIIELHTGAYAHAGDEGNTALQEEILKAIQLGAKQGAERGLEVHAGHGLSFENVADISAIPEIKELNIGHFLMGEAIIMGLEGAIAQMKTSILEGRQR